MRVRSFIGALASMSLLTACVVDLPNRSRDGAMDGIATPLDGQGKSDHKKLDPKCGNGKLDPGERCDITIALGTPGACPDACDDGLACTTDTVKDGGTCAASCVFVPKSVCENGGGCCPGGCDFKSDDDCSSTCGNGALDDKETCDTKIAAGEAGACPDACDDNNSCTDDELINGGGCAAQCTFTAIIVCKKGDGCCPSGCDSTQDDDCSASCGNGKLETGEKCDKAIVPGQPGACPASCDDGKACTTDTLLNVGTCNAQCQHTVIKQCRSGDNCCPSGCNNVTDKDCSANCGNGIVEGGEKCDKDIAAGKTGACPTSCDDKDPCTKNNLLNPGTCSAQCFFDLIQACQMDDQCCPSGCDAVKDNDCSASCGNGVVESPELCDTKITSGTGKCPTSCNDNEACTIDTLQNGGGCSAKCVYSTISSCKNNDGCCPGGCNANNDSDCTPKCGNGVVESGEKCDGNCPSSCPVQTCKTGSVTGSGCQRECIYADASAGTSCSGGKCYSGACCTGCWTGTSCSTGTSTSTCGQGGVNCTLCGANACEIAKCASGICGTDNAVNGTICSGGKCYSGACCTGCWTGTSCNTGTSTSTCGKGGVICAVCSGSECETATCGLGVCGMKKLSDGSSCLVSSGTCHSGACCKGCWDGSVCQVGTSKIACGSDGATCGTCLAQICNTASCTTGSCVQTPVSNGDSCTNGECLGGACCKGCRDHAVCKPGLLAGACGLGGVVCLNCGTGCCDRGKCYTICP